MLVQGAQREGLSIVKKKIMNRIKWEIEQRRGSVEVAVFRPKLDVRFRLSGGRRVDSDRSYVREDNFWTPFVRHLQVFEVPGNHDNMVLASNVRVMVALLRRAINGAESRHAL